MKWIRCLLIIILVSSLLGSLCFLFAVLGYLESGWQAVAAELLLVVVLAAEGLFAIFHIKESQTQRQAESLRDFMHDFSSVEALQERESLFVDLPWGNEFGDIPKDEIQWKCEKNGTRVVYKMEKNDDCVIEITMKSPVWSNIQRLSDRYHFAGLSCKRGYMATEDVLNWMGPQPLRWWRRLGNIIRQERIRRKNPTLSKGFEDLAILAQTFFRNIAD